MHCLSFLPKHYTPLLICSVYLKRLILIFLSSCDAYLPCNNRRSCAGMKNQVFRLCLYVPAVLKVLTDIQLDCFYFPDPLNLYQFVERPFVYPCQSIMKVRFCREAFVKVLMNFPLLSLCVSKLREVLCLSDSLLRIFHIFHRDDLLCTFL